MQYILIGKNPVRVNDSGTWAQWFGVASQMGARTVKQPQYPAKPIFKKKSKSKRGYGKPSVRAYHRINQLRKQPVLVSTVFLGLDHRGFYSEAGDPVVFETMIFGGQHDGYQKRYTSWDDAERGHKKTCSFIDTGLNVA